MKVKVNRVEGCLGETLPLAGIDFLLSLDPEVFLDPPLEVYHVGHELGVQHAACIARDRGRFVKHVSLAAVDLSKESLFV